MWLSIQTIEQILIFIMTFSISMALSLFLFFKLKEWFVDKSDNESLKEENEKINTIIEKYQHKF